MWTSGRICLNLLNEPDGTWHGQWSPSITIKQILCAIQELLDNPFPAGARPEVQTLYERNRPAYERRLRQEADKYRKRPLPDDDDDVNQFCGISSSSKWRRVFSFSRAAPHAIATRP